MRLFRIYIPALLLSVLFFLYTGCTPEAPQIVSEQSGGSRQLWQPADRTVCVVFGPGYADFALIADTLSLISEQVGLEEDGGLIRPLLYPGDFLYNGTPRISQLEQLVSDDRVTALILLGNPEGSARVLSSIRSKKNDMCIISVFPQDDPIAAEAVSSFILDSAVPEDAFILDGQSLESGKIPSLVLSLALYAASHPASALPVAPEELRSSVSAAVGNTWSAGFYTDPDTGIRSANHFILTDRKKQ